MNDRPSKYKFSVDLTFTDPGLINDGVRSIIDDLAPRGYHPKLTQRGSDSVSLELPLPPTASCSEAERATLRAIETSPTTHGKAFVRARSGAVLTSVDGGPETWVEINPASTEWFRAQNDERLGMQVGTIGDDTEF